jgi:hypothetical protein
MRSFAVPFNFLDGSSALVGITARIVGRGREEWAAARGQLSAMMALFGIISSASSVISLIQHIGNISLFGVFAMYIKFYRDVVHPIIELIPNLCRVHPPMFLKDIWTISALAVLINKRTDISRAVFMKNLSDRIGPLKSPKAVTLHIELRLLNFFAITFMIILETYTLYGIFYIIVTWIIATIFTMFITAVDYPRSHPVGAFVYNTRTSAVSFYHQLFIAFIISPIFFIFNAFVGFMR